MKNITYLFGAGASYNACPIWKEQAEKMMELPSLLNRNFVYKEPEYNTLSSENKILWMIGYIGKKASEFNTVDTYAKKLYLQNKTSELNQLKTAVSYFFSLWTTTKNPDWKYRIDKDAKNTPLTDIDFRYINLLATYLKKGADSGFPKLSENIKFITWNYDLQLIYSFFKFTDLKIDSIKSINNYFPFIPDKKNLDLNVCHLNGFHSFYGLNDVENLLSHKKGTDLNSLINSLNFLIPEFERRNISFSEYINFAWERESDISSRIRENAIRICNKTNILVVVGYSFPPFNYEIDKTLFESLTSLEKLIIQDPKGDAKFIAETFDIPLEKISVVTNTDQFVIPNYGEKNRNFVL